MLLTAQLPANVSCWGYSCTQTTVITQITRMAVRGQFSGVPIPSLSVTLDSVQGSLHLPLEFLKCKSWLRKTIQYPQNLCMDSRVCMIWTPIARGWLKYPRCKSRSENDGLDSRTAKMSIKVDEVDGSSQAITVGTSGSGGRSGDLNQAVGAAISQARPWGSVESLKQSSGGRPEAVVVAARQWWPHSGSGGHRQSVGGRSQEVVAKVS